MSKYKIQCFINSSFIFMILSIICEEIKMKKTRILEDTISNKIYLQFDITGNILLFNDLKIEAFDEFCNIKLKKNQTEIVINSQTSKNNGNIMYNSEIAPTEIILEFTKNLTTLEKIFTDSNATKIIFDENFNSELVTSMKETFKGAQNLKSLDISHLNTENIESMYGTFLNCRSLTELNLVNFKTPKLNDMNSMFRECTSLKSIDLSNFNTSLVTDMQIMFFCNSALTSINLSSFDTRKVTAMNSMFQQCGSLTSLDLSSFETSNVINMNAMFYICKKLELIKFGNFSTEKVETMYTMFCYCSALTSIDIIFNLQKVENMGFLFYDCGKLKSIIFKEVNAEKITSMEATFSGCSSLTSIDLHSFKTTNKLTTIRDMFNNCNQLKSIDLSSFNVEKVENMDTMFKDCINLKFINLGKFNAKSATSMNKMFLNCKALTSINLNSEKVNSMDYMFSNCISLTSINLTNFNLRSVISMKETFSGCSNLNYLYLESLNLTNLNEIYNIFLSSDKLTSINLQFKNIDLSSLNEENEKEFISKIFNLTSGQYENCTFRNYYKDINYKFCSNSMIFKNCSSCENENIIDYCIKTIEERHILNFHYYSNENNNNLNGKKCEWINGVDNYTYIDTEEKSDHKCLIKSNNNISLCTKCDNSYNYYQLKSDNLKLEFDCYNKKEYPNYYIIKIDSNLFLDKCDISCSECIDYSNHCLKCNNAAEYYALYSDYVDKDKKYLQCYNKEIIPSNYFFDNETKTFKECYHSCKTCEKEGNKENHNCLSCKNNYIFLLDVNSTKNCYNKCQYYYYFTSSENPEYTCTEYALCPVDKNLLERNKKQCLKNCKDDDINNYQYNSECIPICPNNTNVNENNICEEDANKCNIIQLNFELLMDDLDENKIQILVNNYIKEFVYTKNHISVYENDNYRITLYKNLNCFDELDLNITKINLTECLKLIKESDPEIGNDLIFVIIEIYKQTIKTIYNIYNGQNYEQLPINEKCYDQQINIEKYLLNFPGINETIITFFSEQGINVFNPSDPFYYDICFHYESLNHKDIPLKDRFITFFPNVTLCEDNCLNVGVDLIKMKATCECPIKSELIKDILNSNIMQNDLVEVVLNSNLEILKCYKNVFNYKFFKKNYGSFFVIIIICIQVICAFFFIFLDKGNIKKYINEIYEKYNDIIKPQIEINGAEINNLNDMCNINPNDFNNKNYVLAVPPVKKMKTKEKKKNSISLENGSKSNFNSYDKFKTLGHSINNDKHKKKDKKKIHIKKKSKKNTKIYKETNNKILGIDDIVEESLDEMEFEDILISDKRSFCQIFWDILKDKQYIINIFTYDNLIPRSLKILLLFTIIKISFVVNALLINENYISNLYYSTEKESFLSLVFKSIDRIVYTSLVGLIVDFSINWFFPEEKKIRGILFRAKEKHTDPGEKLLKIQKSIQNNYCTYIITSFILSLFSWYYLSCFNNVYPNTKDEWIKTSLVILIIMQLMSILNCLAFAITRSAAIIWKNEQLYKISMNFK